MFGPHGDRLFDAVMGLDGIAERLDNVQDSDVANATSGDTNADLYNPTRTTDGQTIGWVVTVRAASGNLGNVSIVYGVSSQLTVAQVLAQATHVLGGGDVEAFYFCAGSDTSALLQLAADAQNQAITVEFHEVRTRR